MRPVIWPKHSDEQVWISNMLSFIFGFLLGTFFGYLVKPQIVAAWNWVVARLEAMISNKTRG